MRAAVGPGLLLALALALALAATATATTQVAATATATTTGALTLTFAANATVALSNLDAVKVYSPFIASLRNFAPRQGAAVFLGDICDTPVADAPLPPATLANAIVFYSVDTCDGSVAFDKLRVWGAPSVVELFLPDETDDPNDVPTRFALNPGSPQADNRAYVRVTGGPSGVVKRLLLTNASFTATISYVPDPWREMYYGSGLAAIIFEIIFYFAWLPLHSIRALVLLEKRIRDNPSRAFALQTRMGLPYVAMCMFLLISAFKIIDNSTQLARDFAGVWVPEFIAQFAFFMANNVSVALFAVVLLAWWDVIRFSRNVRVVQRNPLRDSVFCLTLLLALTLSTIIGNVVYVYRQPGWQTARLGRVVLLGIVAFVESFAAWILGGMILRELTGRRATGTGTGNAKAPASPGPVGSGGGDAAAAAATGNAPESAAEKERRRIAMRRAVPLTRLVIIAGVVLLVSSLVIFAAGLSTILLSPKTYWIPILIATMTQIPLIWTFVNVLSPIWQERRAKAWAKTESASGGGGPSATSPTAGSKRGDGALSPSSPFKSAWNSVRGTAGTGSVQVATVGTVGSVVHAAQSEAAPQ